MPPFLIQNPPKNRYLRQVINKTETNVYQKNTGTKKKKEACLKTFTSIYRGEMINTEKRSEQKQYQKNPLRIINQINSSQEIENGICRV